MSKPPAPDDDLFAAIAAHLRAQRRFVAPAPPLALPPGPARFAVLAIAQTPGGPLAAVQVLGGAPRVAMRLLVAGTGEVWVVRRIGSPSPEVARAGRAALLLAPVGHERALQVGMLLVAGEGR